MNTTPPPTGVSADVLIALLDEAKAVTPLSPEDEKEILSIAVDRVEETLPEPLIVEVADLSDTTVPVAELPLAKAITAEEGGSDVRFLISKMTLPQRVKSALFGNAVVRGLLVRDPNKLIQLAVLRNPKLTSKEVGDWARNPNLSEHIIRAIANSMMWTKDYSVKLSLTTNPKTPGDLALKWIRFLNSGDLKRIGRSKNIPQVIAIAAKKRLSDLEKR